MISLTKLFDKSFGGDFFVRLHQRQLLEETGRSCASPQRPTQLDVKANDSSHPEPQGRARDVSASASADQNTGAALLNCRAVLSTLILFLKNDIFLLLTVLLSIVFLCRACRTVEYLDGP